MSHPSRTRNDLPFWLIVAIAGAITVVATFVVSLCATDKKSWIPNSWEHLYYQAAIIALVVGALWAKYTWDHHEDLRIAREVPGMELDMEFREQPLPNGAILLEIRTTAKNTSVIPIKVNLEKLSFRIEKRSFPKTETLLPRREGRVLLDQIVDTEGITELTLEPMTNTIFTEYFSAEQEALYAVKFSIPYEGHAWVWDRTHLHFVAKRSS